MLGSSVIPAIGPLDGFGMGRVDVLTVGRPTNSGGECYDVADAPFNEREHVLAPAHQRRFHGALVGRLVVNAGDAGAVTGVVIEHRLDHMRFDPDVGHASGDGSPD